MTNTSYSPYGWWDGLPEEVFSEAEIMWVYRLVDGTYQVGFYSPAKEWFVESAHHNKEAAAERCRWLNGGN